jgi:hypothetical protein
LPVLANSPALVREMGLDQHWRWIALLLGLLWVATLLLWWRDRARVAAVSPAPAPGDEFRAQKVSLESACRKGDPHQIRKALMTWSARQWATDPPPGLDALASRIDDPAIGEQLAKLDAACYAAHAEPFDACMLRDMLEARFRRGHRQDRSAPVLPFLYPGSRKG